ncbi:MAG: FixH family protein [Bacteroidia bacterium]|nr:FixH family protein [Bacteroidia bacterium]
MKINWGRALIIFFIIFFVWVFSFVFFAMRQNNDLVTDDYYQKGAKYTDQININQRSVTYQDSIKISTTGKQVQIALSKGLVKSADSVQVYFFRSSDKTKDLRLRFKAAESPFLIDKTQLMHGRYQVYLSWSLKNENYSITKIVDI